MKRICLILFLGLTTFAFAQEKTDNKGAKDGYRKSVVMKAVKADMKAENYSKALDELNTAIKKYDEARKDPEMYSYEVKNLEQMVLAENKKMYLANKPDTTKYFNYLYDMYSKALTCDSLEQLADMTGKVVIRYRYDNAQTLLKYRLNLRASFRYFYKKKDYATAYKFVEMYNNTKTDPLFTDKKGEKILPQENDTIESSVIGILAAYGSQNNKGVVKYLDHAMSDGRNKYKFMELGCKSYLALGDTSNALRYFKKGFDENPGQEYFFMSLVKYYGDHKDHKTCLAYADTMVTKFPDNRNYWFIKASEEEYVGKLDDAIASNEKAIELKADDAEAYNSIGRIYTSKAQALYNSNTLSVTNPGYRDFKNKQKELYTKAKDAYECARRYAPDNKPLWEDGLRNTYFRLNMGKELKELEKESIK